MPSSIYKSKKILDLFYGAQAYSAPATVYVALFAVMPAADGTGGTEIAAAGYARAAITSNLTQFPAASTSGSAALKSPANDINFGPATINWGAVIGYGIYDAATNGNLLDFDTLRGTQVNFTGANAGVITSAAHGFSAGDNVRVEALAGLSLPTGLAASTDYYVRDVTTNTLNLSASLSNGTPGAAISLTSAGAGLIYKWYGKNVGNGDTMKLPAGQVSIFQQ